MSNSRKFTTTFNAVNDRLRAFLKPVRSDKRRKELMQRAASGRDPQLPSKAREAVAARRVQKSIDSIAGRSA